MTCFFLILLYCFHEFTYDQFHPDKDRLYQIKYHISLTNEITHSRIPPTIGPRLVDYFPEIEAAARFYQRSISVEVPETKQQFELDDVFFVDSNATQIFSFDYVLGNSESALNQPNALVLSDETAILFFGTTDVIGKQLTYWIIPS